jgi:2-methylisocitrate lyase-like PEP mutase family enzyme
MTQHDKAARFTQAHVKGNPLRLYNAWDAGSAKAVAAAGAQAIATSSWAVAAAQGYGDGEELPFALLEQLVARIAATVELPVSADFEGGYSEDDGTLAAYMARLLDVGVIGINFEDRIVKGSGLTSLDRQAERIGVLRRTAEEKGVPLFINARTDLFLGQPGNPADSVEDALDRARAYAAAGASGFFVPGLIDAALIARICEQAPLPVNVMIMDGAPSVDRLAEIGVARISYGATPYIDAMAALESRAAALV